MPHYEVYQALYWDMFPTTTFIVVVPPPRGVTELVPSLASAHRQEKQRIPQVCPGFWLPLTSHVSFPLSFQVLALICYPSLVDTHWLSSMPGLEVSQETGT